MDCLRLNISFQEDQTIMDLAITLEMAELDLDDDIIVGINNGSHVDLFEIYKIAERKGKNETKQGTARRRIRRRGPRGRCK